jgi:PAS domain-containing protein
VIGIVFGAGAITIAVRREGARATLLAAILLTLAIVSHHFTAMGAIEIVADPTRIIHALSLAPTTLALAIAGVTVVMLAISLVGMIVDERFRDQSMRLDAALNNMHQGLLMFDATNRLVLHNQRYLQMYGISPETVKLGCTLLDLWRLRKAAGTFKGDPDEYFAKRIDQAGRYRGDPGSAKYVDEGIEDKVIDLPDGRTISVTNEVTPDGGWVATHSDITETTQAAKELQRAKTFLRTVVENVPATIVVKDARDHRYVLVN